MTTEDICKMLLQGEGLKVEFKEAPTSVPASFYETVVSFSNTDGGTILLGVSDDGTVKGVDTDAKNKIQKDIITALNSIDCINPPLYIKPYTVLHPKGEIIVVQIPASSQIHDHAGEVYSREFESDIKITDNQQKISDLYLRKRNFFTETQVIPHLTMDDLDEALFEKARLLIRNYRSDHPWLLVSNDQVLKDSVLWRKDFMTGEEGLTLAAALIFGKEATIQSILPAYKVEAMVRILNKDQWDDRIVPPLRKNLIDTYLELKEFINKHLPERFYLDGDQRVDLRDKIFREVIGNIIVHREYTSALSTEMIITETAVILTNPNRPLFHGPIDPLGFNPYPKNPNIRKFFTAFGWTDEIGSGIRNIIKFLPIYASGAQPLFLENDTFRTEIPLKRVSLGTFARELQKWLELPDTMLEHIQKGLSKVSLPSNLTNAPWEEIVLHLVPTWNEKGTQFDSLNWPQNKQNLKEEIEQVPSWNEKGTQLLNKKSLYLIRILVLASEPIKMSGLLQTLDYRNPKTFRDNYLIPLRKCGFLKFTNSERVNDPNNKYCLTENGKLFLGAMV